MEYEIKLSGEGSPNEIIYGLKMLIGSLEWDCRGGVDSFSFEERTFEDCILCTEIRSVN